MVETWLRREVCQNLITDTVPLSSESEKDGMYLLCEFGHAVSNDFDSIPFLITKQGKQSRHYALQRKWGKGICFPLPGWLSRGRRQEGAQAGAPSALILHSTVD